jgi:hypothetical protein
MQKLLGFSQRSYRVSYSAHNFHRAQKVFITVDGCGAQGSDARRDKG